MLSSLRSQLNQALSDERPLMARPDKYLLWIILVLSVIGVVTVFSATSSLVSRYDTDSTLYLSKHILKLIPALIIMLIVSRVDYHHLAKYSRVFLIFTIVLMAMVQIVGITTGGAARWIKFAGFGFQPSELAKAALIIHVATFLSKNQRTISDFKEGFVPFFLWIMPSILLIGIEDVSTAGLILVTCLIVGIIGRLHLGYVFAGFAIVMALGTVFVINSPARIARIEQYIGVPLTEASRADATFDPQQGGYQSNQALYAFALGGMLGRGPGKSIQRDFLPASYNDFIFAIIAEEWGFLGAGAVLLLYVLFLFRGYMSVARRAPDPFGLFLAIGITTSIVLYGAIHAGVCIRVLPVTGLPMPFVSYGGSALLVTGVLAGILLNISRQTQSN